MSSNKHTPGPWAFSVGHDFGDRKYYSVARYHVDADPGVLLYGMDGEEGIYAHSAADISLIAAAPDLLEACEEAADDVCRAVCPTTWRTKAGQSHNGICLKMRAAIKKARGEK